MLTITALARALQVKASALVEEEEKVGGIVDGSVFSVKESSESLLIAIVTYYYGRKPQM
ncbi:hypothetical protein [Paenibacillus chibensis]|uniref:hypothetical protein n=1 Tax=Paenibacillus chibensis TaxID=59846 RepID=UPI001FE31264|nr:hypothetical protein [Paenibacillus chibensis]MEC0373135.1 hypothetical protein [Paenibacillus chibensis]